MKDFFKKYFLPDGRIGRLDFFIRPIIALFIVSIFLSFIAFFIFIGKWIQGLSWILYFFAVWFSLIQIIKRLHDLDKTGWLSLLMIVPLINFIFWVYLQFWKWTSGPNRFWPDPLQKEISAEVN